MERSRLIASGVSIVLPFFLTGCLGNWKSIHHEANFESSDGMKSKVISVDAKQRFAFIDELGNFCSEPSPDAMSALADAFGLNISNPADISGNLSGSSVESAANIGLRTQSIQLMRDAMYRICELYKNDALDSTSAYMLHSGYQDVMIALLSIEQLTGPVKAAQATLSGKSSANVDQTLNDLEELTKKLEGQKAEKTTHKDDLTPKVETAKKEKEDAQKAYDGVIASENKTDEQVKTAANTLEEKTKTYEEKLTDLENTKSEIERIEEQLKLVADTKNVYQSIQTSSESTAELGAVLYKSTIDQQTATKLSEAVKEIATTAMKRDRVLPACIIFLTKHSEQLIQERLKYNEMLLGQQALFSSAISTQDEKAGTKSNSTTNSLELMALPKELTATTQDVKANLDEAQATINVMVDLCKDWITKKNPQGS